jgi:amino acid transporter
MAADSGQGVTLRPGSIGLWAVAFQSALFMAPGVALAFSFGAAVPFAGNALTLATLLGGGACVLVAVAVGQLAKYMPSAGGLYTYISRAIHPIVGFVVGWWYFLLSLVLGPSILLLGAYVIQDLFTTEGQSGWYTGWKFWLIVLMVIVAALCTFDVSTSTKIAMVMGVGEVIVFLLLALWLIFSHSSSNGTTPFDPSAHAPGLGAANGIMRGVIFAVLAFVGFEAAATLGEESKDPKRIVPRGVILAAVGVGAFYVLCTYAWVVGSNNDVLGHAKSSGGLDWIAFAKEQWPAVWAIVSIALINSAIACSKASVDTAARVVYSMARNGALPKVLAKLHPRYQTPYIAVFLGAVVGVAIFIPVSDWAGGTQFAKDTGLPAPLLGFFVAGTYLTVVMICAYILSAIACTLFVLREHRGDFNVLTHAIIPGLGALIFIVALYFQFWSNWPGQADTTFWSYQPDMFKAPLLAWVISTAVGVVVAVTLAATKSDALTKALDLVTADHTLDAAPGTEIPHAH